MVCRGKAVLALVLVFRTDNFRASVKDIELRKKLNETHVRSVDALTGDFREDGIADC